ncbi:MAG: hypothetical protein CL885_04645 [Dehalococcoidia bacterium]|nr:hypothetical protein [Dehalococcoidia bacterium]|tara:strand:+ start:461 stop:691 length:231 start_codon:yes stop_codon:yes gene_type:complete
MSETLTQQERIERIRAMHHKIVGKTKGKLERGLDKMEIRDESDSEIITQEETQDILKATQGNWRGDFALVDGDNEE